MGLAAAAAVFPACGASGSPAPPPPLPVTVERVQVRDVPITAEWIGTTAGRVNATIRAQVTGYLIRQDYREGDLVRKEQALFEVDPRTFQAALDEAKAQLALQEARWATAQSDLRRIRPLAQENAVSQRELDQAVGNEQGTHASVIAAQATVERAGLELGFTRIQSPIEGIAGTARAQIGDLVGPSSIAELTTVSTVDPIRAYFPVSEQEYLRWRETHPPDAPSPPLDLFLATGERYPHTGRVEYVDRAVNELTGTLRIAALFPNPNNLLRPGQFARVRAVVKTQESAILIPQRAVNEVQGIPQVAVIGSENRVEIRTVKPGERVGELWVIDQGLKPGETVVVEGVQKLHPGMVVRPQPPSPRSGGSP